MTPHRKAPRTLGALLLALTLALPAAAQTTQSTAAHISIDNFGRVNANYFRGAQPEGGDYADLKTLGVKTVIDLTKDGDVSEPGLVQKLGMKFFRIPMTTHDTPSAATLEQFLSIVNDPANQPVYVHCQGGRHRTGLMTAVYRMSDEGWTPDRAFAEMKQYKYGPDFLHPEFKTFVFGYHPAQRATPPSAIVATTIPGR